jgi:hypothetical protein
MCDLGGGRHPAVGGLIKYDKYLPYGHLLSSIKNVRFSAFANPYDIHNRIRELPKPASFVSMTYVKLLSQTFRPVVEKPSAIISSSTNPLGLPLAFDGGNSDCCSASWTSI